MGYVLCTTYVQLSFDVPGPKICICRYLCTRATSPPQKTEGLLMKLLQKNKIKNNLNTGLTETGVFSAVAGNQLPNQMQKRVLPALFHLRYPSQSHQRSARGRTRLTTVTSISCRSFYNQVYTYYSHQVSCTYQYNSSIINFFIADIQQKGCKQKYTDDNNSALNTLH